MLEKLNKYWQQYYAATTLAAFVVGVILVLFLTEGDLGETLSLPPLLEAQTFYAALLAFGAALITASALAYSTRHKEDRHDRRVREEKQESHRRAASILALYTKNCIEQVSRPSILVMTRDLNLHNEESVDIESITPIAPGSARYPLIMELPAECAGYFFNFEQTIERTVQTINSLNRRLIFWQSMWQRKLEEEIDDSEGRDNREIEHQQHIKHNVYENLLSYFEEMYFLDIYLNLIGQQGQLASQLDQTKIREQASSLAHEAVPVPRTEITDVPF